MSKSVLICGASFAGLATAFWMNRIGYRTTVVEVGSRLKKGGTPVNIQGRTIDIVKAMGLLDPIRSHALVMEVMEFKNTEDVTERSSRRDQGAHVEYEIERDVLLQMMFDAVSQDVEFIFGDTVVSVDDAENRVDVLFRHAAPGSFDLVMGCDGIHSTVRKLRFGEESQFLRFLGAYFSITIVDGSLVRNNTTQMYNEPGKAVMLNAYNQKTDIVLCFTSDMRIPYDYRDEHAQRQIIIEQFQGMGWRTPELLAAMNQDGTFYFDALCQTTMPSWTKGRVALVGDSAYCPSPAAGRGGSLAIDGAAALAEAFERSGGDYKLAFDDYNRAFRPFVEQIQAEVVEGGIDFFIPKTADAIRERNAGTGAIF